MNKYIKYYLLISLFFVVSCGDFLDPKSQSEYAPKLVKSLDELLLGEVYMGPGYCDGRFYTVLGLFDDDVAIRNDWRADPTEESKLTKMRLAYSWASNMKDDFPGYNVYGEVYKKILGCNSVIDYIDKVSGSDEEKNYVLAQAFGLRGYFYFHLINLYGKPYSSDKNSPGVPLKLSSEMGTSGMPRNTVEEVYDSILKDLLQAERLFAQIPGAEGNLRNNRINLPFVQLMLSRVYLYMENWEKAFEYGQMVSNNKNYGLLDLNYVEYPSMYGYPSYMGYFTWNNPEVIFLFGNQGDILDLPLTRVNYKEVLESGRVNYYTYYPAVASDDLLSVYDNSDLRKTHYLMWETTTSGRTPKYKKATSKFEAITYYSIEVSWNNGNWGVAFKVTEAMLNAAEAAAMLYKENGNAEYLQKAKDLLDALRIKRYNPYAYRGVDFASADELIEFVRNERRRELCFENHRWFDLRRYGMNEIKHTWYDASGNPTEYVLEKDSPGFTLLIPNEAFEYNPDMKQNPQRN